MNTLFKRAPPLEVPTIKDALLCARPVANEVGAPLFHGGSINLHQLLTYIAAPCLGIAVLSSLFLIWKHLHRYTAPKEQRQIIRIVFLPIAYAVVNFISLLWYQYYLYIQPIAQVFEALAVAALFLLALEYVAPDGTNRDEFFDGLEARNRRGKPIAGGSLKWYRTIYMSCLQYPLSRLILTIIVIITQYYAVYCENSWRPGHAHLWIQLADWFFIGGALMACLRFVRRFRRDNVNPEHKMMAKARTLVPLLLLQILQGLLFGILCGALFHPSPTATFNDIFFGVPAFMTCVEAAIFSLLFHWSFSSHEFLESERLARSSAAPPAPRASTWRAIADALNISDLIVGTIRAYQMIFARLATQLSTRLATATSSPAGGRARGRPRPDMFALDDRRYPSAPPHAHKTRESADDSASAESGSVPLVFHRDLYPAAPTSG